MNKKNKYLAINIGPISDTLSMARKPREFWAASYLFSYLMECILERLSTFDGLTIISPYYDNKKDGNRLGVGLYPDRCFYQIKAGIGKQDIQTRLHSIVSEFAESVKLPEDVVKRYFNIMAAYNEYSSSQDAISGLNRILDYMELNRCACDSGDYDKIINYLRHTTTGSPSPLFPIAFGGDVDFKAETLEIAKADNQKIEFSRQKYICIVQADGDGMGRIVKSSEMEGKLDKFSNELMEFGKKACKKIKDFKGQPIYAGGDDLLFIAPVCGTDNKCILDLIDSIDEEFKTVEEYVRDNNIDAKTSMSYGISIIYYKYPLYEAWKTAAKMLFENAKKVTGKNAIAINLRKNSGSELEFRLNKKSDLYKLLKDMILNTPKESIVSAIAHKVRANDILLNTLPQNDDLLELRMKAFYDKIIDVEAKTESAKEYMELTRRAFVEIYKLVQSEEIDLKGNIEEINKNIGLAISMFYSMLRIAKFIKGEELKDE